MDLKQNDKIILIVGVVILIVAGIGIAMYTAPTEEVVIDPDAFDIDFEYRWKQITGRDAIAFPFVDKRSDFEETYRIQAPTGSVLTRVSVLIDWEDDHTYGIFRTKGADTLTAEVIMNGISKDEVSVLKGNLSFPFNVNPMPRDGIINATSETAAASKLMMEHKEKNIAEFDVVLSVEIGEPWWRPIRRFRDKGNSVDISVEYTYYITELTELENDIMKRTGEDDAGDDFIASGYGIGNFYVNLAYGRGMI